MSSNHFTILSVVSSSGKLIFRLANVPGPVAAVPPSGTDPGTPGSTGTYVLRLLLCNNADRSMVSKDVVYEQKPVDYISMDGLDNGVAYDAIVTAYEADNEFISQTPAFNDAVPASSPYTPTVVGSSNLDLNSPTGPNSYNIHVNVGANSGSEVTSITINVFDTKAKTLRSINSLISSSNFNSSTRIATVAVDMLSYGITYSITASTRNAIGSSAISAKYDFMAVNAPDTPTTVVSNIVNNQLVSTWRMEPGSDARQFTNVQNQFELVLSWVDASSNIHTEYFAQPLFDAILNPITYLGTPPIAQPRTYAVAQGLTIDFSSATIQSMTTAKSISYSVRVKFTASGNSSANWGPSPTKNMLNVSDQLSADIIKLVNFSASGIRSTAIVNNTCLLSGLKTAANSVTLYNTAGAAKPWFDIICYESNFIQSNNGTPAKSNATLNVNTSIISRPTDSTVEAFTTGSSNFSATDVLVTKCYLKDSVNNVISYKFSIPDIYPKFASKVIAKEAAKCIDGVVRVDFEHSKGTSDSIVGSLTLQEVGLSGGPVVSGDLVVVPIDGKTGWFYVSTQFSSFESGASVDVTLRLYDLFDSEKIIFYNQSPSSDNVIINHENYAELLQLNEGICYMAADLVLNPQDPPNYAAYAGLNREEYALFLGCLPNEVLFEVMSSGTNAGKIKASLSPLSATYNKLILDGLFKPEPLYIKISATGSSLVAAVLARTDPLIPTELEQVKSLSGSSYVLAEWAWFDVILTLPSNYAPGINQFLTSVTRTKSGVTYVSDSVLNIIIVDVAFIAAVETRKYALALNVNLNGAVSAVISVQPIPVYTPTMTEMPAAIDLSISASGWQIYHLSYESSAYVYAIVTNNSTSNSLVVKVTSAPVGDPATPKLPNSKYGALCPRTEDRLQVTEDRLQVPPSGSI